MNESALLMKLRLDTEYFRHALRKHFMWVGLILFLWAITCSVFYREGLLSHKFAVLMLGLLLWLPFYLRRRLRSYRLLLTEQPEILVSREGLYIPKLFSPEHAMYIPMANIHAIEKIFRGKLCVAVVSQKDHANFYIDSRMFGSTDDFATFCQIKPGTKLRSGFRDYPFLIFLATLLVGIFLVTGSNMSPQTAYEYGGFAIDHEEFHGLYRFITGSLLHANYHHLLANVFALFCLLRLLEPKERLVHLVGLYLTGCIVGFGMAYFGKSQIVIGVSGVAFCYATYLILKRHYGINNDIVLASFLAMFVLEMIIGALVPYVSTLTHVGGAIGGILYFLIRYNIDSSFTSYSDDNGKQESLPS